MTPPALLSRAAAPLVEVVRGTAPDQLDARTPCEAYDVRGLVNHLLFWAPSLAAAAAKQAVPPPAADEKDVDLARGDWASALESAATRTATAWDQPQAWEGVTGMGGPMELPASMVGGMVLGELVVHGWDLARATGQHVHWDDDVLELLHDEVAKIAEQGREMGVFGPEVVVPEDAPVLDRLLGLTGRDPGWGR